jgi:hypothetical protein
VTERPLCARLHSKQGEERMQMRRQSKQETSLNERLANEAHLAIEKADQLPPGPEREALLKKARQADTAAHINDWLNSPGLRSPK